MPVGPGKYDDLCTEALEKAHALAAILLIFGGNRGSGFSVQAPLEVLNELPSILRSVADQIELDRKKEGLN
jgi:hypothetical protein